MSKGTVLWLTPPSIRGSRTPPLVWGEYMAKRGWKLVSKPSEDVEAIFIGSDGLLEQGLHYKHELDRPAILYFWGYPFFRLLNLQWRKFYQRKISLISGVDMILVPSLVTYYQLADFGVPSQLCVPGIDNELIDSIPEQERKPQVMYLGRFADYRRVDVLVRAVSALEPQPELVLAGWDDPAPYRKLADELKVHYQIFHPDDREKVRLLKESMVFVCPCVYAGWGMPPVEAMYAGVPVLAMDTPIHREVLKEAAIYFSSAQECADLIAYVINNKDVAKELSERGRMYVAKNLTFEKAAERLEYFLNEAINFDIKKRLGERVRANPTRHELTAIYDEEARRNWRFSAHKFSEGWLSHYRCQLALKELVGKRVLDVGCGYGSFCILFAKAGYKVVGLDISPVYIKLAKELMRKHGIQDRVTLVQGFAEDMEFEDEQFDSVFVGDLFEHVQEPERVMEECLRVVKPRGRVILSTPYKDSFRDPLHLHKWDVKQFKEKVIEPFKDKIKNVRLEIVGKPPIIFGVIER